MRRCFLQSIFFITVVVFISCDNHSDSTKIHRTAEQNLDSIRQVVSRSFKESSLRGEIIFKNNCAVCHCFASCEPGNSPRLKPVFDNVSFTSLPYFVDYIKDSKSLKDKGDKHANEVDLNFPDKYEHGFESTLTQSEMEDVILYIWRGCK